MAKRFTSSSIKWSFIAESVLPEDQHKVSALKLLSDRYSRQLADKPTELPKIDWSYYKTRITLPGMVDTFQKGYEALKIPYPSDQGALAATETSNDKMIKLAEEKLKEMMQNKQKLKQELEKAESMMKYSDMTLEEYVMARPGVGFDPKKPRMAPVHLPDPDEEQEIPRKSH